MNHTPIYNHLLGNMPTMRFWGTQVLDNANIFMGVDEQHMHQL